MEYIIEASRLSDKLSYRVFGRKTNEITELYNRAIFSFMNDGNIDMIEFVYRRLMDVNPKNKLEYLNKILELKLTDSTIVEEIAYEYSKIGKNPYLIYYQYASRTNNVDYMRKALRFVPPNNGDKTTITEKLAHLETLNTV